MKSTVNVSATHQDWVIDGYTLGHVTRADAEYLMGAPALAGGWIMVPGEWSNVASLWEAAYDSKKDKLLALIPIWMSTTVRPISRERFAGIMAAGDRDLAYLAPEKRVTKRYRYDAEQKIVAEWMRLLNAALK